MRTPIALHVLARHTWCQDETAAAHAHIAQRRASEDQPPLPPALRPSGGGVAGRGGGRRARRAPGRPYQAGGCRQAHPPSSESRGAGPARPTRKRTGSKPTRTDQRLPPTGAGSRVCAATPTHIQWRRRATPRGRPARCKRRRRWGRRERGGGRAHRRAPDASSRSGGGRGRCECRARCARQRLAGGAPPAG